MKHSFELDFALDRTARKRRRQVLIALLGLCFGLQVGLTAWRLQSLADAWETVQQGQRLGRTAHGEALTAEQIKVARSAQAMLDGLSVPWDDLLYAIESARPPRLLVDAIEPRAQDGTVSVSVNSSDFATVAEFVRQLMKQEFLTDVTLVSETLSDAQGNTRVLRAVITAKWHSHP